ncbi:uncharacterized protein LOC107263169 isoform X2 [Cephus cinctus]|nr:uncharacterized protein LOC107263169 isoform X2 [Cephus cinctus]XP_024936284.1 uncharacterized protein LOC107263169 isoform X2 [Cephus cinctus]
MVGNQLIIRMEKDKNKGKKKRNQWEPPCDCDMVEIRRSSKEGPKIVNGGDNNQILFKIHSKNHMGSKDDSNYKPQAIAYKVGACRGGQQTNDQCRTITVHPQFGGPGSQEVHSDHIREGNHEIFLLRIKKKGNSPEQRQQNIELELKTPKPPTPPPTLPKPPAKEETLREEKSETKNTQKKDEKKKKKKEKKKK